MKRGLVRKFWIGATLLIIVLTAFAAGRNLIHAFKIRSQIRVLEREKALYEEKIARGIYNTYTENNLRYSQNAPLSMYEEVNTGCNLPAQIDIHAGEGDEYHFLFVAKGGGSANKTYLY